MKKSLLILTAASMACAANAQVVLGLASDEDLEAAGLSSTKVDMPADTKILENEAGSFYLAYDDSWGTSNTYKTYRDVTVDGEAITLGKGAVGNLNPVFVSYEAGVMSGGAVFKIESKKVGFMTVFTRINPNKQYLVFEGKTGPLAYSLGWTDGKQTIHYATPMIEEGDEAGLINFDAPDASKYFIAATEQGRNEDGVPLWQNKNNEDDIVAASEKPSDDYKAFQVEIPGQTKPAMPWNIAGFEKAPGEATGFLTFSVLDGNTYYFSALGSKAVCGGFVFTETEPTIVFNEVLAEDGTVANPAVEFKPILGYDAVETIGAVENADAPVYNMMGVRVNADAKGILIQNGKKFIRK